MRMTLAATMNNVRLQHDRKIAPPTISEHNDENHQTKGPFEDNTESNKSDDNVDESRNNVE